MLIRAREKGNQKARAMGPYIFKRYIGCRGVNTEVVQPGSGTTWEVSASNIIPMHPTSQQVNLKTLEEYVKSQSRGFETSEEGEAHSSEDSRSSISDPPGVIQREALDVHLVILGV